MTDTISIVLAATTRAFAVTRGEMMSHTRRAPVVEARHVAMYQLRTHVGWSYPRIARALHRQDHTTAMHAIDKIKGRLPLDADLRSKIRVMDGEITQALKAHRAMVAA